MEKTKGKLWEKGIIIALLLIVYQLVLYFTHQMQNSALGWIGMIGFIVYIIVVTMQYAKQHYGSVTFGNLFAYGFKISAIVALITVVWVVLMYKVIFPGLPDQIMASQRSAQLKAGITEEQLNASMEIGRKFFIVIAIGATLFMYAILGVIGSLLGAAFSKKGPVADAPFQQ